MAATDQNYRNQYGLDVVFGVTNILMLGSIIWMLADDYQREYKTEQRQFRDVEMAMAQRDALQKMPRQAEFDKAKQAVEDAERERKKKKDDVDKLDNEIRELLPKKERAELTLSTLKAHLDSKNSFYDIECEHGGPDTPYAKELKKELDNIQKEMVPARAEVEEYTQKIKGFQRAKDDYDRPLTTALSNLKKLLDDFDRQVTLAHKKKWGFGDVFRSIPVIDGFAAPTKIEQYTLNDLTIDYNFKGVTRFDRCTTCHKGIARPSFTKADLEDLWYAPSGEMKDRLDEAQTILAQRKEVLAGMPEGRNLPEPDQLRLTNLSDKKLTQARINEFCAHPRLDLFVGPNSKHPAEKFGCTSCHSGQPSGTSFTFAAHTPNDAATLKQWQKEHDWESQHMWDFPMLPQRFIESSCLKCHHQVTDLYSDGNKTEAPKLLKGYGLIREFGCFGCHEINGNKDGRSIGPDLRLEPNPPLERLTPEQRAKLLADPDNPPGTMRKVGPSLFRVSEKTYKEWALKWLMAPREFRPDTKMPHYYGLSNNDPDALHGTGQEHFPTTEIHGIVHYLFNASHDYLQLPEIMAKLETKAKDGQLSNGEKKQLDDAKALVAAHGAIRPLDKKLGEIKGNAQTGRDLFSKKGCLACHSHAVTNEPDDKWPAIPSEAEFGPNLTQVKEKLVKEGGDDKHARLWLTNWVKDPTLHSPRTRMPITHLTDQEAADIAAWLLAQNIPADEKTGKISEDLQGQKWATMDVPAPTDKDLQDLARVYLVRTLADFEIKDLYAGKLGEHRVKDLGADERELADLILKANQDKDARRDAFLHFAGKKAIGRLGCFGCHNIPGFDNAKLIGTALADWGKKDPNRLAFDDVSSYVKEHFKDKGNVVDSRVDEDGYPRSVKKGPLYETFYYDALIHKTRDGFLHQKLLEPRSYDFNKLLAWDDRARMPQFKFGRIKKKAKEDSAAFNERKQWAEAMFRPLDSDAKPRPAESTAEFMARKDKEEADQREAVMTFVLGLVAEPIPLSYLNRPSGDRFAEVKGRQVIDKFNCAGCHVLRPGVYEFKLTAAGKRSLEEMSAKNVKDEVYKDDFFFPEHRAWNEPTQASNIIETHGVRPLLSAANKKPRAKFVLTEALKVRSNGNGNDKDAAAFRAKDLLSVAPGDMIWPPPTAFRTTDSFQSWDRDHGAQGGAFAALLSSYLKEDHPDKTKYVEPGPFVPPLLIWQGERTQPDWLFQFLLDPHKVREQTVLRMPKFNMSEDEARAIVNYFAAIEKRFNPDIDLVSPYPKVPQRAELDSDYWKGKTATYIQNLKNAGQYDKEVAAFKPIWEKMIKEWKVDSKTAAERKEAADKEVEKLAKVLSGAKDDKQKAQAQKDKEQADLTAAFWKTEKDRLDKLVETKSLKELEQDWGTTQAYAIAGYRLVVNQCNKCHAVGNLMAQQIDGQGPSLSLAESRLRPEWSMRWIANPQRFVPYNSAMPAYFKKSDTAPLVPWVPGNHFEQIDTARDTILNLQLISELPLTRYFMQSGAK
jgi:mono/diheme cytochrome c family protein